MEQKPIYLKLTPLDEKVRIEELKDLTDITRKLMLQYGGDNSIPFFGSICSPVFTSIDFNYEIVEFYPHSAEIDKRRKTRYATDYEATQACFKLLKNEGYSAKPFDLESWLSRV
jgi:hypothetical protein